MLAELEVFHSRPIAPTRRVALGERHLPIDGDPGVGVLLLSAVVARHIHSVDPDLLSELVRLTHQVERGLRVPQPRLRHRFQKDHVGLLKSTHRAYTMDDAIAFSHSDERGTAAQQILGAVYVVADQDIKNRRTTMAYLRRAMRYEGDTGDTASLLGFLVGSDSRYALAATSKGDPRMWAKQILGINGNGSNEIERDEVIRKFRELLREAHPDSGEHHLDPADRIAELSEARRILLK